MVLLMGWFWLRNENPLAWSFISCSNFKSNKACHELCWLVIHHHSILTCTAPLDSVEQGKTFNISLSAENFSWIRPLLIKLKKGIKWNIYIYIYIFSCRYEKTMFGWSLIMKCSIIAIFSWCPTYQNGCPFTN